MTLRREEMDGTWEVMDGLALGVHPLISRRRSRAGFGPEPLTQGQIMRLLHAARCAPSSHNSQPWRFVILSNGPNRAVVNQTLAADSAAWAVAAPVLLAVLVDQHQSTRQNGLDYALFDTGLAVQNLLLQANSMGLAAHPLNYYDPDTIKSALRLPPTYELVLMIAVGYPSEDGNDDTESTALRKPLADIVVWDEWGGVAVEE